jgi:hypothetical protein
MSYEMTLTLQRAAFSFPFGLTTHESVGRHMVGGLGGVGTLVRLAQRLDGVVVAYDATADQDHVTKHQSVVNTVGNLVGHFALQAIQAEVVQIIRYGLQAGGAGALGALGLTSKQKPDVMLVSAAAGFIGGYLLGELNPMRRAILQASWNPYSGWTWANVSPPESGWSPNAGGLQ